MPDQTMARLSPRPAVFALCLAGSLAAAEPAPVEWVATAGVRHRTLSEWSATGARLLTEKGFLPHLQLSAQLATPTWPTLAFEAGITGGDLDYHGQTQSGVPLTTTTRQTDLELSVLWRPLPGAAWGEAWLGLDWLQARRNIASSPSAGGLAETSSLVLPGVRWRSPTFALPSMDNAKFQLEAQWRSSVQHRLEVDYLGVFDNSSLHGGRRSEVVLGLNVTSADTWWWSLEWSHSRQSASSSSALYLGGVLVGGVQQPRVEIDDVSLLLRRRF
jgi:hypothetical protein